jgi:hypothetical protein
MLACKSDFILMLLKAPGKRSILLRRLGQHVDDIALAVLVAIATDKQGIRLRPGVLPALGTGELRLAGPLGLRLLGFRGRLPVKLKARGLQLRVGAGVGASGDDDMRDRLAGFLASGLAGRGRLIPGRRRIGAAHCFACWQMCASGSAQRTKRAFRMRFARLIAPEEPLKSNGL